MIVILGTFSLCWLMLNWIVRNRTVWSFNCVYLQNVFTNHIFNEYVKTGFAIKLQTMVDMPENQIKANLDSKPLKL